MAVTMAPPSQILFDLAQYLMDRTGPGKPWAPPPEGILWTPIAPIPSQGEALARALKARNNHIGVLMPTADRKVEAVRSPYEESLAGGTVRELQGYLTVFIRSMDRWPIGGAFPDIPAILDRILRDYHLPGTNDTVRLEDFRLFGVGPDYLIMEGSFSFKYFVPKIPLEGPRTRGFKVYTTHQLSPTGWWFVVYLDQGGNSGP